MEKNMIIEVVTTSFTYVGKYVSEDDNTLFVEDLMVVNIIPYQTDDGKIAQTPRLEPRNLWSTGKDWKIKKDDILYCNVIDGPAFIKMYTEIVLNYNKLKTENGNSVNENS